MGYNPSMNKTGQASLTKRYFGKLLANIATVPIYLIMEAVLPRALGPQVYGNFNFATAIFTQVAGFLDMGTSTCFYNALSRRQAEATLVSFYAKISLFILVITLLCGFILLIPELGQAILPDVPLWYAPLAAMFGFLLWGTRVTRSMNDALGLTVAGELLRSGINLLGAALLVLLFVFNLLDVKALFALQYLMMGSIVLGCLYILRHAWPKEQFQLTKNQQSLYVREFFDYSSPLFVQALLTLLALMLERWLLQWFSGSAAQGYFALSQKISMACFMFVTAMTPLIMRELSIAWGRKDLEHMGSLLTRFAPMLFAVAAWFSCFSIVEAKALVHFFGGTEFLSAILPVQIMALYPAHQAYGQLASSVFHATAKTKTLRNLSFIEHLGGMVLVWFFLAPPAYGGLGWGAVGLALKIVITQAIMVNLLFWMASKLIPLKFWKNLGLQGLILIAFVSLAWLGQQLVALIVPESLFYLWKFFLSGMMYSCLSGLALLLCPQLFGCTREDLHKLGQRFTRK